VHGRLCTVSSSSDAHTRVVTLSGLGRQLFETAPDAVVIVDGQGVIQFVNDQATELFAYGREELLGHQLEVLIPERIRQVHPSHRARYFSNPTTRPMGAGLDLTARRRDGTEFPVDIALSSFETEEGRLVTAAIRDITDWVRTNQEKEMLEAQIRLHQTQRLESIGQLAGGVAHDFNNLLAASMSYCQLIEDGLRALDEGANDKRVETLLHDIGQVRLATERATELTRRLLTFSRREVVKPEILSVNETVTEMEKLLRRTIGENIELTSDLDRSAPLVEIDRGQIEQILMNLVVNARDAMPSGGRLQLRTGAVRLEGDFPGGPEGITSGDYLMLSVSDTGTGMSREVLDRVFEPFFTTKERGKGSGLGLATVYGIVTQAGGYTTVYSEPGMGTTLKLYVPASQQEAMQEPEKEGRRTSTARGETILLVEDEDAVREPTRRLLEAGGYLVLDTPNPDVALEVAEAHPDIDLLLTDVVMPGMTGKELADRLQADRPNLKVVFVSGYSEDVIVHQGAVDPGVVLIEKPFTREILLDKVREVLDA